MDENKKPLVGTVDDFVLHELPQSRRSKLEGKKIIFENPRKDNRKEFKREQSKKKYGYELDESNWLKELKKEYHFEIVKCEHGFVSDGIDVDFQVWKPENPVFISAQTGRGKNHFIEEVLATYVYEWNFKNEPKKRILLLSNRIALRKQIKERLGDSDTIDMLSYQSYLRLRKKSNQIYTHIICDECHFFTSDSRFNPETHLILEKIINDFKNSVRIYMTSTFNDCIRYIFDMEKRISYHVAKNVCVSPSFLYYKFERDYSYLNIKYYSEFSDLYNVVVESVRRGEKWLIFIDNKKKGQTLKSDWLKLDKDADGVLENSILVINSESKGNIEYDDLITNEKFKQKVLISTSVIDNGVNFKDSEFKNIVISDIDKAKCLQMVGRKRVEDNEIVNLYIKKFDMEHMENQIEDLKNQKDAYYAFKNNYRKFLYKYYNGDISDFEGAKRWFYRVYEKPKCVLPNEIAISLVVELIEKYEYILERMGDTGDGQEFLEHQLSWFGENLNEKNDITFLGSKEAKAHFNEYIDSLLNMLPMSRDEFDSFRIEFTKNYLNAYGHQKKSDGFESDEKNRSRTKNEGYSKNRINEIFIIRKIDLEVINKKGAYIIESKTSSDIG